jgi:hypothetical protein
LSLRKKWYELICILFDSTANLLNEGRSVWGTVMLLERVRKYGKYDYYEEYAKY